MTNSEAPRTVLGKNCPHTKLDERGRCTECGVWAVLSGQVPVRSNSTANPKRTQQ